MPFMKLFLTTFQVLHYGPKAFSINNKDVFTHVHELPDDTWPEPTYEDPLSLIDQVKYRVS